MTFLAPIRKTAKLLKLASVYFALLGRIGRFLDTVFGPPDRLFIKVRKVQSQKCDKVGCWGLVQFKD
jgi:rRNA processing protein Gar1